MPTTLIIALSASGAGLVLAVVGLAVHHAKGVICGADWCLGRGDGEGAAAENRAALRAVESQCDVDDDDDDGDGRCA